jgi:GT2 family glycosyltransferase
MTEATRVTVVVPMLDEEPDIAGCIRAIAAQRYPRELLELLLVDGGSKDATIPAARAAADASGIVATVLSNPRRRQSAALNVGLLAAKGDVYIRVDARSRIQQDYVSLVVETIATRPEVGVVGGAQVAIPRGDTTRDRAIARALNNRWTMGGARYRRGAASGFADTVWLGAFRTAELAAIGGWDESLGINEDYDLNERYRTAGRSVWFDARMRSSYLPRPDLRRLHRQYLAFGRAKGSLWVAGRRPRLRHVGLLSAPVLAVAAAVATYRRAGPAPTLLGVCATCAIVDHVGSDRKPASLPDRVAASVTAALVAGSWWAGVVSGAGRGVAGYFARPMR